MQTLTKTNIKLILVFFIKMCIYSIQTHFPIKPPPKQLTHKIQQHSSILCDFNLYIKMQSIRVRFHFFLWRNLNNRIAEPSAVNSGRKPYMRTNKRSSDSDIKEQQINSISLRPMLFDFER